MEPVEGFGEMVFRFYCLARRGLDHQGNPIPAWADLNPEIKIAWEFTGLQMIIWWERGGKRSMVKALKEIMEARDEPAV